MALAVSAREQRRDRTTSCDYCAHPFEACQKIRISASPYVYKTDFIVEGYGSVPVTNGDPKWLPTRVEAFIAAQVKLMKPAEIHICNGSWSEADYLASVLERKGMLERLGAHDNVFVARTDPRDAMERRTFIVTKNSEEVQKKRKKGRGAKFTRWMSWKRCQLEIQLRFAGCMRGRVMYVIPFAMGPIGGRYSINAVQLTDSPFVVLNMRLLTRVSSSIWDAIGNADFVRCVHSIGRPRPVTIVNKYNWICHTGRFFLCHRLDENEIWSFGSTFGENAFLGTKSLGLRLASYRGWKEDWLAMNAALIAIKGPSGKEVFGCVALPKGVGKTEVATMTPTLHGWQVQLLGDDIAWIRCGPNGKLYASAPANGLFACPDDASPDKNENIFKMLSKNAILINCATTSKGRFHWEALEKFLEDDEKVTDWKRQEWTPEQKRSPAHMNCHYTVLTSSAPNVHPSWELSSGVPLSFIVFGCKRADEMPLVYETESWEHGVLMAAGIRTISHSALDKPTSALVHDPMCMRTYLALDFCHYIQHWLNMKQNLDEIPKIFMVNWHREGKDGKSLWPGIGESIRVFEWIVNRCVAPENTNANHSAIGWLPQQLNVTGLETNIEQLLQVDKNFWEKEIQQISAFLRAQMGNEKIDVIDRILTDISERVAALI